MGLFPDCDLEKVMSGGQRGRRRRPGGPFGQGPMRAQADWIARNVEYIELTVEEDFEQQFMESMQLPHMTDEFPHLEGVVRPEILHQK